MVFVTTSSAEEAGKITDEVLRSRQAACATTIQTVQSKYWWEGKLVTEQESLVILKTTVEQYPLLQESIKALHSYKVPEIVAVPVPYGLPQYIEWVRGETS